MWFKVPSRERQQLWSQISINVAGFIESSRSWKDGYLLMTVGNNKICRRDTTKRNGIDDFIDIHSRDKRTRIWRGWMGVEKGRQRGSLYFLFLCRDLEPSRRSLGVGHFKR